MNPKFGNKSVSRGLKDLIEELEYIRSKNELNDVLAKNISQDLNHLASSIQVDPYKLKNNKGRRLSARNVSELKLILELIIDGKIIDKIRSYGHINIDLKGKEAIIATYLKAMTTPIDKLFHLFEW